MPETAIKPEIRWLIRRDLPEVLEIERENFSVPCSEDEFLAALRERTTIGLVAVLDNQVVGYVIYCLEQKELRIINFVVKKSFQRQGIGTAMINRLKDKLSKQRRTKLSILVNERWLGAQLFLRAMDFWVWEKSGINDNGDDIYLMEYLL